MKRADEDITLHTSKPLSRIVKASFNPLLTDRILSTTVPIKVRCSSEMVMTHKYRGSIIVLSVSKSDEPNEEQKETISGIQQGILCKY